MASVTVCRMPGRPTAGQRSSFRAVLNDVTQGMSDADKAAWRSFWIKVFSAEAGELFDLKVSFVRNPKFHRKFFAMLNVGFDAWDPASKRKRRLKHRGELIQKDFDAFRKDVIILAGFYTPRYALDGKMELEAASMSFANMDEIEFEALYSKVVDVLLAKVLTHYTRADLDVVVDRILHFA